MNTLASGRGALPAERVAAAPGWRAGLIAVAAGAAAALGIAATAAWLTTPPRAGPDPVAAARATAIEFAGPAEVPARGSAGILVLDLDGLEDADAALDLLRGTRRRDGVEGLPPVCWVLGSKAPSAEPLHEAAVRLVASGMCRRVILVR